MRLDTVELIMSWEDNFGITLEDSDMMELRTPRQVTELISVKPQAEDHPSFCPRLRAFHIFRNSILKTDERWTRSLVRFGVRASVAEVTGVTDFSDDDRFVEDIGMD